MAYKKLLNPSIRKGIQSMRNFLLFLFVLSILISGCASSTTFRVLDAKTGEPIEGAVALAEWIGGRRMAVIVGPTQAYTAKAVEAVSDSEGKFIIPGMTGKLAMQTPHLKVYKPGYVGWDSRRIYLGCYEVNRMEARTIKRTGFTMKDQDILLEPWKDEYSFISHGSFIAPPVGFEEGGITDSKYRKAIRYEVPYKRIEKKILREQGK
jgi:hypothetical protein